MTGSNFLPEIANFKSRCIYAPFVERNQRGDGDDDDAAAFFESILICQRALMAGFDWCVTCTSAAQFYLLPSLLLFHCSGTVKGRELISMFAMQCHFFLRSVLANKADHFQGKSAKLKLPWKHGLIQQIVTSSCWHSLRSEYKIKRLVEMDIFACFIFNIICRRVLSDSVRVFVTC